MFKSLFKPKNESFSQENTKPEPLFANNRPPIPKPNKLFKTETQENVKITVEYHQEYQEKIDKMRKSQPNFQRTSEIMKKNQEKLQERSEKINNLAKNAQKMAVLSKDYKNFASQIKEKAQGKMPNKIEKQNKYSVSSTFDENNSQKNAQNNKISAVNSNGQENHYKDNMIQEVENYEFDEMKQKLKRKDEKLIENIGEKKKLPSIFSCC